MEIVWDGETYTRREVRRAVDFSASIATVDVMSGEALSVKPVPTRIQLYAAALAWDVTWFELSAPTTRAVVVGGVELREEDGGITVIFKREKPAQKDIMLLVADVCNYDCREIDTAVYRLEKDFAATFAPLEADCRENKPTRAALPRKYDEV